MSQATELLNSMSPAYGTTSESEPHIVIDSNRVVTVPEELKRLAVQYDHCIEKITFDCPRYWDEHDMSRMHVYVNYLRSDGEKGSDLCTNVVVDKDDETMMHFDWEITGHLSAINGNIAFLACIMKSTPDGEIAERHWNSELNTDCYVSEGLEAAANIYAVQPGVIDALLTRMEEVDTKTSEEAMFGYLEMHFDNNPQKVKDTIAEYLLRNNNGQEHVYDYMRSYGQDHVNAFFDTQDDLLNFIDDYIHEHDYDITTTVTIGDTSNKYIEEYDNYEIGDSMLGYTTSGPFFSRTYVCEIKLGDIIEFSKLISTEFEKYSPRFIITDDAHIVCDFIVTGDYPKGITVRYEVEKDGYFYFTINTLDRTNDTPIFYIKNKKEPNVLNIDKTLSFTDMAADAKVVGDRFTKVDSDISDIYNSMTADSKAINNKFNAINNTVDENQRYLFKLFNSLSMSLYDDVEDITPSMVALDTIFSTNSCKIGDSISGLRPNASPGYFMYEGDIQAGDVLEIGDNFSIPEGLTPSDNNRKMLIVDNENIIVDMVDSAYLTTGYAYVVPIDGRVIVSDGYKTTSEIPILFIKHPYNYLTKTDDTLTKSGKAADAKVVGDKFEELARSSKPYFINMDKIDTTDPAVGEAVIDAFFAGRTLIVTDSTQDPGVDQRGYRFVQWVGLPRNGWNMVELRLSDDSSINLAANTRTGNNPYEEHENN